MRNELRNVNQGVSWLDRFFYGRIPAVAAAKFSVVPLAFLFFWVTANDWCQSVGGSLSLSLSRTHANKKKKNTKTRKGRTVMKRPTKERSDWLQLQRPAAALSITVTSLSLIGRLDGKPRKKFKKNKKKRKEENPSRHTPFSYWPWFSPLPLWNALTTPLSWSAKRPYDLPFWPWNWWKRLGNSKTALGTWKRYCPRDVPWPWFSPSTGWNGRWFRIKNPSDRVLALGSPFSPVHQPFSNEGTKNELKKVD